MKKFNPCLSTTLCVSFLFTLNSCTTDSVFVSDDTLAEVNRKNEDSYHEPNKVEVVSAQSTVKYVAGMNMPSTLSEAYHMQDSISTYSSPVTDNIIDPDWKKLITRVGND